MRRLLTLAAVVLFAGVAPAQTGTAVEVRVESVNELLEKAEYLGEIFGQGEQAKQGTAFVRAMADEKKGIEGVDPARPVGLYASVTKDVIDSPVVLMIPIADEEAFLALLTGKLNLEPKKGDDGAYKLDVPNVPVPVFFRFANKYAYATVQSSKNIDPKGLVAPKDFFTEKETAVTSARVFLDRVPADVKKTVLAQFELKINDAKEQKQPGETDAQRKLRLWGLDQLTAAAQTVLAEGSTLTLNLNLDPKADDVTLEVAFVAKDGSDLAKVIRSLDGRTGTAAALAADKATVASGGVKFALPDDARKSLAAVIDAGVKEAVEKAQDNQKPFTQSALDSVVPTLKSGELEAAFVVTGESGKLGLVASLKVVEGGGIEKVVKQLAAFVPAESGKFEFDVKKAGGLNLHKITAPNPQLKEAFGTETVWLGTSNDLLLVSIEPDGKAIAAAAEGLTGKGRKVRPAGAEVSVARAIELTEKQLKPAEVRDAIQEAFGGSPSGKDTVTLAVDGGAALTVKLTTKGKALRLFTLIDQAKKK